MIPSMLLLCDPEERELMSEAGMHRLDGSPRKALELYARAAMNGSDFAFLEIETMVDDGEVDLSDGEVVSLYSDIASEGCLAACGRMACMYEHGRRVERSWDTAVGWLLVAADHGHAIAYRMIADMYGSTEGPHGSMEEYRRYLEMAGDAGHGESYRTLGDILRDGDGVERSPDRAIECYSKAFALGIRDAGMDIARMYHDGDGVERSGERTAEWLRRCGAIGEPDMDDGYWFLRNLIPTGPRLDGLMSLRGRAEADPGLECILSGGFVDRRETHCPLCGYEFR